MTIHELSRRIERLDVRKEAIAAIDENKDNLLELNKRQMMEGKTRTGADITPSYQDDPFFKTPESAQRYSDWKDSITPNSKRRSGTPNLFIVGTFHNSISVSVTGEVINYNASFRGATIESKFGDKIYGLSRDFKVEYLDKSLRPTFNVKVSAITGLKFR